MIGIRRLANYLMIPVATVLIVGIGVFIPAVLLKGRADPNKLPSGYADIDNVQPYGATYWKNEQILMTSAHEYSLFMSQYDGAFNISDYPCRESTGFAERYDRIGTAGVNSEFVYEFTSLMQETFDAPDLVTRDWDIRDQSENIVLLGDVYGGDGYVLDRTTGVPIYADIHILSSSGYCDMRMFLYEILDMYNDYTGLDFSGEIDHVYEEVTYYDKSFMTSDNELTLFIEIDCMDCYAYNAPFPGYQNGDYYYTWHIRIQLQSTEDPVYSMPVG